MTRVLAAGPSLPTAPQGPSSVTDFFSTAQTWLWGIAGTAAVFFLTVAGILYISSGGHMGAIAKAKGAIKSVLIGTALLCAAPLLVSVVFSIFGSGARP